MENTKKEVNEGLEETVNSVEMNEQMDTAVSETYDANQRITGFVFPT